MNKILLILDLDETLIHASKVLIHDNYDFKVFHYYVYKRPFLDEFIKTCSENFQLAIWSSASDDYVIEIVKNIIPHHIPLAFVWGRSRCTPIISPQIDEYGYYNLDVTSHYEYAKKLFKVKRKGYDLKRVLIVDDTPAKVANNYGNAIYSKEFKGEKDDKELTILSKYLLYLKDEQSVRTIEKRNWRRQIEN
ncbi:phosphoprotein phosphatase [bacterium 336/3]|nr:phosphoprotein phosphatase [bacterium 336/3]